MDVTVTDIKTPDGMAAEAYIARLGERGIEYVFANAGTDFAPIVEALSRAKDAKIPRFMTVPHENVAMAMAHGYYRIAGKPAAVMVHVTVGTANAINGLINAARDNIPLLLAAGRTPLTEAGSIASRNRPIHWGQEAFDQGGMLREYVKWDYELRAGQPIWLVGRLLEQRSARDDRSTEPDEGATATESTQVEDEPPRYLTLPGPKPLLGWEHARGSASVCVVEGVFDVLTLRMWGYPVVVLVGTHTRPDLVDQLRTFARSYLVLDNDDAGLEATLKLVQELGNAAVPVALPDGIKDVAELAPRPDGQSVFAAALMDSVGAGALTGAELTTLASLAGRGPSISPPPPAPACAVARLKGGMQLHKTSPR